MFCKKCGTQVEDGVAVCPKCGNEIKNSSAAESKPADTEKKGFLDGLYKTREGKLITGVCAGTAKKYNKTPWFVRIIFIIVGIIPIVSWVELVLYIVAAIKLKYIEDIK